MSLYVRVMRSSGWTGWRRRLFRFVARGLQHIREASWTVTGYPAGAHALPIRADGRIVLVRLTYARGWRLPGGGLKKNEHPRDAAIRELQEEIGMIRFTEVEQVFEAGVDPALGTLFIVRGVEYQPRASWEVEAIEAFPLDALPEGATGRTRRWIRAAYPSGA
jgi:ADP-ribose pyrophosphatase YjhB (NUDIX family)